MNIKKFLVRTIIVLGIISFLILPFNGCNNEEIKKVNVILLIGDGMGEAHIEAARIYQGLDELNMEKLPYSGYVGTNNISGSVTDSAAAATAMATGVKVANKSISMKDGVNLKSITEYAMEQGRKTGIVATKFMYDATPAAFSSHAPVRINYDTIVSGQINSGIDVFLGEGKSYYDNFKDEIIGKGYTYFNTAEELAATDSEKLFGAFNLLTPDREPSLEELAEKAINTLDKNNDKGFFLMIEGSDVDSMSHSNDMEGMIAELMDFDAAVKKAVDFAKSDGNTMVIVVADHETGDLIIPPGATAADINDDCFKSGDHTGKKVKYFALGGCADNIGDEIENTGIFDIIIEAFGIKRKNA